jgi:lysophospholipase L1-like esterase
MKQYGAEVMHERAPKYRELGRNLLLTCASLLAFFLVCELVVFRFILPATDMPENAFTDGVIRHAPDQTGVYRLRDEIEAPYRINDDGWNSGIADYREKRTPGIGRIAVIGDSFVEAFEVPFDSSFAELTQKGLTGRGCPVEVYRFGISGAPLSQYLHVLEREALDYRPDWVVVSLIHNDFTESFEFKEGRYTSSFLKLGINGDRVTREIPPHPYAPSSLDWLRFTATFRYIYYTQQVHLGLVRDLVLGKPPRNYQANIDVDATMRRMHKVRVATDYLIGRIATVAKAHGIKLLFIMDGDRRAIYDGVKDEGQARPLALNRLVGELTARHGVPFIDLHPRFARDWQQRRVRFEHESDAHWNEAGHRLVADALVDFFAPHCGAMTVPAARSAQR